MAEEDNLQQFKSHLNLIKSMTGDKAEEQFYQLMEKAKVAFGELGLYMAEFYFEYAKFLLEKLQKNIDIFNAGSLPVGHQQEQSNPIPEDMIQDDSSVQDNSQHPKSENNANGQHNNNPNSALKQQNNQPQIVEDGQQQNIPENNQIVQPAQAVAQGEAQNAGQDDDYQVCADNLLCAIKIFETERDRIKQGGDQTKYTLSQISRWISRCKSRLGDLHHLSQNYNEAIAVYLQVIQDEEKKLGHQSNRGVAQIHYMIANSYLYDNKEGCQKNAIKQFIKSVSILLNYLNLLNPEDTTFYEIPTQEKVKVDRFAYLPKSTDSEEVKQIKQVISLLLDKIQDAFEQISIRAQYEAEKQKQKQQGQQNKFKQVTTTTPVVKLGTFGNRKKKAQQLPDEETKKKSN